MLTLTSVSTLPDGIFLDVLEASSIEKKYQIKDKVDVGQMLKSHEKAILFAVPGAFTPTWWMIQIVHYKFHIIYHIF